MNRFDFFELLQVAVGNRERLSHQLSDEEWAQMLDLCTEQTLDGIGFAACRKLDKDSCPPKRLLMQWAGQAVTIAERSNIISRLCVKVARKIENDGFNVCILKGQSNLVNYPAALRDYRTPGDIDLWMLPKDENKGKTAVIDYVREQRCKNNDSSAYKVLYYHVSWNYKGVDIEAHFRPSFFNNPVANWNLQRWCKKNRQWHLKSFEEIPIPTVSFNVIYQLVHINRHLFDEGIGLRQLLDYYFVLKAFHDEPDAESRDSILRTMSRFNLRKFAGAVMYVLQTVFAMPNEYLLCEPREKEGQFLLDEIMMAGNFGQYDARNVVKADEGYVARFIRRQRRFMRFLTQYPSEVLWGPFFSVTQRCYRVLHGYK